MPTAASTTVRVQKPCAGMAASAIKTDFILSAEIMAITLAAVPAGGFWTRAVVLAVVGVGITAAVYGAVALIVKADDIGVAMARNPAPTLLGRLSRAIGTGLVRGMPGFLRALAVVGTAAMIWVGGGIIVHGLETYGLDGPAHLIDAAAEAAARAVPVLSGTVGWLVGAAGSGVIGLAVGLALIPVVGQVFGPVVRWLAGLRRGSPKGRDS